MADGTPDPAASALDEIRERAGAAAAMDVDVLSAFSGVSVGGVIAASAVDVPRLLAAVEAALGMVDGVSEGRYAALDFREAITAALAGKLDEAKRTHDERCCMTGNPPGLGPHPDCPGYPYWPDEER
jgi:hypothetical protein